MADDSRNTNFVRLMNALCSDLGCCGGERDGLRTSVTDYIPVEGRVTAQEFAVWVLRAEGLDVEQRQDLVRAITSAFIAHMGTSDVPASDLDWG